MAQAHSPSIIVFDVNETLLDLTTLEPLFERLFGKASMMREWFAQLILYSEALTLSGIYVPFGDLAAGRTVIHPQNRVGEIGLDPRLGAAVQGLVDEVEIEGEYHRLPHPPIGKDRVSGVHHQPGDPGGPLVHDLGLHDLA